jgi:hypothetical protein
LVSYKLNALINTQKRVNVANWVSLIDPLPKTISPNSIVSIEHIALRINTVFMDTIL